MLTTRELRNGRRQGDSGNQGRREEGGSVHRKDR